MNLKTNKAVGYLRTSSATNVGSDKDSETRQRLAINSYAKSAGIEIVEWFFDAAVSGGDPVVERPGFSAMLKKLEGNGTKTIVVETASRFARDLMVQEVGYAMLCERGIDLIAADSPASFLSDTPSARLIRQILGAVSGFERAITVARLRGARDRKRAAGMKVEGRKGYAEVNPALVAEAKRLRRRRVKGGQRSLREIASELASMGHMNSKGRPFSPSVVKSMVESSVSPRGK